MTLSEAVTKPYRKPPKLPPYGSLATIAHLIKPGDEVLDVGCAEGYLATYLPNNKVWGLDGNKETLAQAKATCIDVRLVDLNDIPSKPYFNKKYDVVVFADVLEHLHLPEQVLHYFQSYLKPGGRVILSLPNVALWRVRLNLLFGRFNYTDYGVMDRTHLHLYTFKTARELVQTAGFKVEKQLSAANALGFLVHYIPVLNGFFSIHIITVTAPLE